MALLGSLADTLFLTFIHNQDAIGYFLAAGFSFAMLLFKPSRNWALLLFGFIVLLVGFEYNKHIIEPLQDQTLSSLGLNGSGGTSLTVVRFFQKLLPVGFFIVGWGSVFLGLLGKSPGKD